MDLSGYVPDFSKPLFSLTREERERFRAWENYCDTHLVVERTQEYVAAGIRPDIAAGLARQAVFPAEYFGYELRSIELKIQAGLGVDAETWKQVEELLQEQVFLIEADDMTGLKNNARKVLDLLESADSSTLESDER